MALIDGAVLIINGNDNWLDASGNGNHGTPSGATFSTDAKLGSHAGNFDKIDDKVNLGTGASLEVTSAEFSVATWIKLSSAQTNKMLLDFGDIRNVAAGDNGFFLALNRFGNNNIDLGKAGIIDQPVAYTFAIDTYYRVVAIQRFSGGAPSFFALYVNGVFIGTYSHTAQYNSYAGNNKRICGAYADMSYYGGKQDEIVVWNRGLTDGGVSVGQTAGGEIAEDYNGGAGIEIRAVVSVASKIIQINRTQKVIQTINESKVIQTSNPFKVVK